jgi:DNA repair protein RecO
MRESIVELGIIVKTVRVGDNDVRLTLFTAGGIKYATAKGVIKPRARFASSVGLFTVAEFTISGSTITGINVLVSPFEISKDINRYYLACSIADTLLHLEFVERTPEVFGRAVIALTELADSPDKSCYRIFIEYFLPLLTILGYSAELDYRPD